MKQKLERIIFTVDRKKKKQLYKEQCAPKGWQLVITVGLPAAALLFMIVILILGFCTDTFLITDKTSSAYGQKNFLLISIIILATAGFMIFLSVIGSIAIKGNAGRDYFTRVNENLSIQGYTLIYSYQNKSGAAQEDRIEVTLPLEQMEIRYDEKNTSITFTGAMQSIYYGNDTKKQNSQDSSFKEGSFLLYDYFTPALTGYLQQLQEHLRQQAGVREESESSYAVPVKDILRVAVTKDQQYPNIGYVIWKNTDGIHITGIHDWIENPAAFKRDFIRSAARINHFSADYTIPLCKNQEELDRMTIEQIEEAANSAFLKVNR